MNTSVYPIFLPHPLRATSASAAAANHLPKRSEVPLEETWDLSSVYADDAAWEASFAKLPTYLEALAPFAETTFNSASQLLAYLRLSESQQREIGKLFVYAGQKNDEDTANATYSGMETRLRAFLARYGGATAFFAPGLAALPEDRLQQFYQDEPNLRLYQRSFAQTREAASHLLPPEQEALLAKASDVLNAGENIFGVLDNADQKFPVIKDENGENLEITHGRFGVLLEKRDRRVRQESFEGLYSVYRKYSNTYAEILASNIKSHNYLAEIHHFSSAREAALFANEIPEEVYDQLLDVVHRRIDLLHRYVAYRRKKLALDTLYPYDLYVPVASELDFHYSFAEAKEIIFEALKPLGKDYLQILEKAFSERWIDWGENEGKRSGAYSGGAYDTRPFVLMTWKGSLDDLHTLIHELGHSMHSYLTRSSQKFIYGDYPIFLAEIASTTNENLLDEYLLAHTKDKATRQYLLLQYLDSVKGTVFRQTQFAEFEHLIHQAAQQGTALTADWLCEQYGRINASYYGPSLATHPDIALEWARIPHFYYNYYVYQYATGFSAAVAFSQMILRDGEQAARRYLDFLRSGCSRKPLETLRLAGVDMQSPSPIEATMDRFENFLSELEAD